MYEFGRRSVLYVKAIYDTRDVCTFNGRTQRYAFPQAIRLCSYSSRKVSNQASQILIHPDRLLSSHARKTGLHHLTVIWKHP